jgi:hypothetical protein
MKHITLKPVKSSNVESVGYDAATKQLAVKFKSGGKTYVYDDVPPEVHHDLNKAESVGKFIGANVVGKFKNTAHA